MPSQDASVDSGTFEVQFARGLAYPCKDPANNARRAEQESLTDMTGKAKSDCDL